MAEKLTILCLEDPKSSDLKIAKIGQHLGILSGFSPVVGLERVVVAAWQALQRFAATIDLQAWLLERDRSLFVYGWDQSAASDQFLTQLTSGTVLRTKPLGQLAGRISVALGTEDFLRQMAGLEFEVQSGSGGVGFEPTKEARGMRLLCCRNQEPFLVELKLGRSQIVLSGFKEIADLDSKVGRNFSILEEFEHLVPLVMFLRKQFPEQCWHAEKPLGCLLIDDPLIRPNYGYVNYEKLLQTAERQNGSISIAFIPWNYRRTNSSVAALFNSHPGRFSICVHGCDHTSGEFGTSNEQRLRHLTRSALWRMEQHERMTGVRFDLVMVFPQGLFSTAAMNVLAQSRFVAAINSTPFPADGSDEQLTLRDMLEPAITQFANFPLLIRRYPKNLAEFALDLFLGKPVLIVEHHGYFREGCQKMENFMAKLNALDPNLHWSSPGTICSSLCLQRANEQDGVDVRFYTDWFVLRNASGQAKSYVLHRRTLSREAVRAVKVNSHSVSWEWDGQYLRLGVTLPAGQQAEITVERTPEKADVPVLRPGPIYKTKVFFRRHLSEFRDNYVDKARAWAGGSH